MRLAAASAAPCRACVSAALFHRRRRQGRRSRRLRSGRCRHLVADAGIRYLLPEIVLVYKARPLRAKDDADFDATLPVLDDVGPEVSAHARQDTLGHPSRRRSTRR